jgi:hypothetical protein
MSAVPAPARQPDGAQQWARDHLGPPTLAFLCATLILYGGYLASGVTEQFLAGRNWAHWDSFLYESIATHGDTLMRCPGQPGTWCGNAGWFPGYPVLLTPLYALGLSQNSSAEVVSWIFDWGVLVLLWSGYLQHLQSNLRYVALTFAACVPGGVLMRSVFPMSMTDFFLIWSLLSARSGHWRRAGIIGAGASFCYVSALALAPVLAALVFLQLGGRPLLSRSRQAALAGGLVLVGFVAACVLELIETGRWNAYFLVQQKYHHGLHSPEDTIWPLVKSLFNQHPGYSVALAAEATLGVTVVLVLLVTLLWRLLRRSVTLWDCAVIAFVVIVWFLPATQANLSYWRGDTLLLPAALVLPRAPVWLAVLLTAGAVAVMPLVALYFIQGQLI